MNNRKWSERDDLFLKQNATSMKAKDIAYALGRTKDAVIVRASHMLGVKLTAYKLILPKQGKRFGDLITTGQWKRNQRGLCLVEVRCSHGGTAFVSLTNLNSGNTSSCSHWRRECPIQYLRKSPEKQAVENHHFSIFNSKSSGHKYYRGVPFFDGWNPDKGGSFLAGAIWIVENLGRRPKEHSLHIIHHDIGFVPGNLSWEIRKVQNAEQLRHIVGRQRREIEERDAYIKALEMVLDVQRDFRLMGLRPETEVIQ